MLMKVFNKGQVVIPSSIRKKLRLHVGDLLDVAVDEGSSSIILTKHDRPQSEELAGSLSEYGEGKKVPSRQAMQEALKAGLLDAETPD